MLISKRRICFDEKIKKNIYESVDKSRFIPKKFEYQEDWFKKSWFADNIDTGTIFTKLIDNCDCIVLCRTYKHVCILQQLTDKKQVFSVPVSKLEQQVDAPLADSVQKARQTMFKLLDPLAVERVSIRKPSKTFPIIFEAISGKAKSDYNHVYVIIDFKDKRDSVVLQCTSSEWSPHVTPLKLLIATEDVYGDAALWKKHGTWMNTSIAADASRLATVPREEADAIFPEGNLWAVATQAGISPVVEGLRQMVLAHTHLTGEKRADDGDFKYDDWGDLSEGHEDLYETGLVVGHYEVDESCTRDEK